MSKDNPREEVDRVNDLLIENTKKLRVLEKKRMKLHTEHSKAVAKYYEIFDREEEYDQ